LAFSYEQTGPPQLADELVRNPPVWLRELIECGASLADLVRATGHAALAAKTREERQVVSRTLDWLTLLAGARKLISYTIATPSDGPSRTTRFGRRSGVRLCGHPSQRFSTITDVRISAGDKIWIAGRHTGWPFVGRFTSSGDVDPVFLAGADPGVVWEGTVRAQGCPGGASGLNELPQVVEQNFLVTTGPNTISVVHKAVLISQCFVDLVDF
jgi:hypothetical protein